MSDDKTTSTTKTYLDFLDDMGKLLQAAMPRLRRLRSQLAVAEERRELAQSRYDRERTVLMEMFGTWKEVMALPDEGETPVRMVPEMDTASYTDDDPKLTEVMRRDG